MAEEILPGISELSFDKNKEKAFGTVSPIVWARSSKGNAIFPLAYNRKPKHISQAVFDDFISRLAIGISRGEVKK